MLDEITLALCGLYILVPLCALALAAYFYFKGKEKEKQLGKEMSRQPKNNR